MAVDEHNVLLRQQDAAAPHHGVMVELVDLIKHPINPMKPGRMGRATDRSSMGSRALPLGTAGGRVADHRGSCTAGGAEPLEASGSRGRSCACVKRKVRRDKG
jgi:hypothetical protein